jgi:SEC-C motif-containing protein
VICSGRMPPAITSSLLVPPHIVACVYDNDQASKSVFDDLTAKQCSEFGVMRLQTDGLTIVAACADDEAAALYSARLPWGPGTPIRLSSHVSTALAARRAEGKRLANASPTRAFVRRGCAQRLSVPNTVNAQIVQMTALNTDPQPWLTAGGICGALCPSLAQAAHIRDVIVGKHLPLLEGMVVAFGGDDSGVAAVVADTRETNVLASEALLHLAGNLDYKPDCNAAWTLWALRIRAGSGPLPISFDGDLRAAHDFLAGKPTQRIKVHAPTRNQPCTCGSGIKYKRCCGR